MQLDAGHKLVSELRKLSHKDLPPFEPRQRKVTLMVSASSEIARREARICEHDAGELESKFLAFFTPDETEAIYVQATKTCRCSALRNIVEVSPVVWRMLQLSGTAATDATALVFLHRPDVRRGDETTVVARNDG